MIILIVMIALFIMFLTFCIVRSGNHDRVDAEKDTNEQNDISVVDDWLKRQSEERGRM